MNTIDDRFAAAVEELERSLDTVPEPEFHPGVTRLTNLAVVAVAAVMVLGLIAIPAWLTRDNSGELGDTPPVTTSVPSTTTAPLTTSAASLAGAILVADLGDLVLISPVVLDDGTIVARASLPRGPENQSDPEDQTGFEDPVVRGFGRSTDGGATWTFVPTDETMGETGFDLAAVGDVLVAPMGLLGVLVSQDSGETWSAVVLPTPDGHYALGWRGGAVVVDDADRFVLYSGNGKWISSDGLNWEAGIQDNSLRSLKWLPQMVGNVLVAVGEDDRIYAVVPGEALEVSHEPDAELVDLAAGRGTVVAWGASLSGSGGTWLGVTTDGFTWSEHGSDLLFTEVVALSDELGAGYLAMSSDRALGNHVVYRSPDLDTWTEIARIGTAEEGFITQAVEVDGGVLAIAWGIGPQTVWLIELDE